MSGRRAPADCAPVAHAAGHRSSGLRAVRGWLCPYTTAPGRGAVSLEVVPMAVSVDESAVVSIETLHMRFLALLPRIQLHAQVYFRHVRCPVQQEDAVQ